MTYISRSFFFGQIFVQGRILSSISGSKLIFHIKMYRDTIFVIGRFFSSTDGSKLIFY